MKKIILLVLILSLLSIFVYRVFLKTDDIKISSGTIAIINGTPILTSDYIEKFNDVKTHYSANKDVDFSEIKNTILRRMIINTLIFQEAKDKNITVSQEELDRYINNVKQHYSEEEFKQILINQFKTLDSWTEEMQKRLLIEKTLSVVVIDKIDVSEQEIEIYYKKFYSEKHRESKLKLAQIFTSTKASAENVMEKLSSGTPFAEVARSFSEAPEAQSGGVVGVIGKGESIELFDIAFGMKVNEVSEIIQSDYGFHILKVLESMPPKKVTLSEAKSYILNEITKEKESEIYEKWLKHRFENSKIIKNVALLEGIK